MQAFSWLPSRMLLVMSLMVNAWSVERAAELAHGADSLQEVIFEPTVARYVRLVVYSEAAGDGTQLGVADLQWLGSAQGKPLPRGRWKVLDARGMSAEDAGPSMAIDTDVTTIWRARGEPPHYLDLDLGESASLSGFRYLPASDGVGVIHEYSVFVSDDAIDWGDPIMRGELAQRSEGVDKETSAGAPERLELVRQDFATEGMVYGREDENNANGYTSYRQFYVGIDFDLSHIHTKSPVLKTLLFIANMVKLPAPALEFTKNKKLNYYWFYF